jgi:hypothetical protein
MKNKQTKQKSFQAEMLFWKLLLSFGVNVVFDFKEFFISIGVTVTKRIRPMCNYFCWDIGNASVPLSCLESFLVPKLGLLYTGLISPISSPHTHSGPLQNQSRIPLYLAR